MNDECDQEKEVPFPSHNLTSLGLVCRLLGWLREIERTVASLSSAALGAERVE
jgi:hypothetical protein